RALVMSLYSYSSSLLLLADSSRYFLLTDPAYTQIYTLSLHDALPISLCKKSLSILANLYLTIIENGIYTIDRPFVLNGKESICRVGICSLLLHIYSL